MTREYLEKANDMADNLQGAKSLYKDLESIIGKFQNADSFGSFMQVCRDIEWFGMRKEDKQSLSKAMAEAAIDALKDIKEQVNKDIITFEEQFEAL